MYRVYHDRLVKHSCRLILSTSISVSVRRYICGDGCLSWGTLPSSGVTWKVTRGKSLEQSRDLTASHQYDFKRCYGSVVIIDDDLNDAAALVALSFGTVVYHNAASSRSQRCPEPSHLLCTLQAEADIHLLPRYASTKNDNHSPDAQQSCSDLTYVLQSIPYLDLASETDKCIRKVLYSLLTYNAGRFHIGSWPPKRNTAWSLGGYDGSEPVSTF